MSIKRLVLCIALLSVGLLLASSAQAKKFSLTGGGGQAHIGNGLALPIQQAATPAIAGTNFPALLVPVLPGNEVTGTTVKPLLTGMATSRTCPAEQVSCAGWPGPTTVAAFPVPDEPVLPEK